MAEGNEKGEKEQRRGGGQQGECNECEERETEIIVEITYELRAEETGGNEIEEWGGGERAGEATRLFPRDFLIIYRARVFLSFVARK